MTHITKYYNEIITGDCLKVMKKLPESSCDVMFADPPYNLQLSRKLYRPNNSCVKGVDENWDKFSSFKEYDNFSKKWLKSAQKILKPNGSIWVMGSYHNIFRLGKIMQDLGYWILNDITWIKRNPMPNFRGVRFTNSQETIIWAKRKTSDNSYYFNYEAMKTFNDDKQMTSCWHIPICSGKERLRINGQSLHPTQKPLALLYRIILASTKVNDVILDPFFGTGTTGVAAKTLNRNFIGIELNEDYVKYAKERILSTNNISSQLLGKEKPKAHRVSLGNLLEANLLTVGDKFYNNQYKCSAKLCADGSLYYNASYFSMNKLASEITNEINSGWNFWVVKKKNKAVELNLLRDQYLKKQTTV